MRLRYVTIASTTRDLPVPAAPVKKQFRPCATSDKTSACSELQERSELNAPNIMCCKTEHLLEIEFFDAFVERRGEFC